MLHRAVAPAHAVASSRRAPPGFRRLPHVGLRREATARVFDKLKQLFQGAPDEGRVVEADFEDEGEEANTMRLIDTDVQAGVDGSDMAFGPQTVLLVGFSAEEVEDFRRLLLAMEADMFKVSPCTRAMLAGRLQEALEADCPDWEQLPLGTRRCIVLSGMFGAEVVDVVAAYRESGLPPCVFAAAVPNNMNRVVGELVAEVVKEDSVMRKMEQERAAQPGDAAA
ncbi:hypothetical protein V8C86DRAFT_2499491 [Haematococcus lacustris]